MIELKVNKIIKRSPEVWSFFMSPAGSGSDTFAAGQVAVLELEGYSPAYLAFASAPSDEGFEFLVKRSTIESALAMGLFDLGVHARVLLTKVVGHGFPLDGLRGRDLVLIAMGTGIAPLRSVVREIIQERERYGSVVFLHGARTPEELYFSEEIDAEWRASRIESRQVISRPNGEWSGPTGYVQNLLDHVIPDLHAPLALVCGSGEMIKQTKERLLELGFTSDRILTNY